MKILENDFALNDNNVWTLKNAAQFFYSDGDDVENYILESLKKTLDVSIESIELKNKIKDWPSQYHFSNKRANLLRPFKDFFKDKKILEIGCGCGSITRFLGECGAEVVAVEGSINRATIARERCRDLSNVTVVCSPSENLSDFGDFDAVLLIGVLEYARKYIGEDGEKKLLKDAYSFLNEQGMLFLAIENKLGLKYLAGAPEDHIGEPFIGVHGLYEKNNVATYGRQELEDLVTEAGFKNIDIYLPFPDYKLPTTIVTPLGWQKYYKELSGLISETPNQDPQKFEQHRFSLELAHKTFWNNGLGADVANSFLYIGKKHKTNIEMVPDNCLSYTYTVDRLPDYNKKNTIVTDVDGNIVVESDFLEKIENRRSLDNGIKHVFLPSITQFHKGNTLLFELIQQINKTNWDYKCLIPIFTDWLNALLEYFHIKNEKNITTLPGKSYDMTLFNAIRQGDGNIVFFDKEWEFEDELPISFVVIRNILYTLSKITSVAKPKKSIPLMLLTKNIYECLGLQTLKNEDFLEYLAMDQDILKPVVGWQHTPTEWLIHSLNFLSDYTLNSREKEEGDWHRLVTQNTIYTKKVNALENTQYHLIQERDQLHSHVKELENTQSHLIQERDQLHNHVAELENTQSHLIQEPDQLHNHVADINQHVAELEGTQSHLIQEPDQLKRVVHDITEDCNVLRGEIDRLKTRIDLMLNSRSWKITKPLRFFKNNKFVLILNKTIKSLKNNGFIETFNIIKKKKSAKKIKKKDIILSSNIYGAISVDHSYFPKVSVIVPNYNHNVYLRERLNSIYNQSYKNIEVILLDDGSSDDSIYILKEFKDKFPNNTTLFINKENSGGVFLQWKKGIRIASGDLFWIAESDDTCDLDFIEKLIPFFQNNALMLAFCRTDFIVDGNKKPIWSIEEYLSDLDHMDIFSSSFIKSSKFLVNNFWNTKNIIPNVSSVIFRNFYDQENLLLDDPQWLNMKVCGDWLLYLNLAKGGLVGYTPFTTNYYRQHEKNTSVNSHKELIFYKEHEIIMQYIANFYGLTSFQLEKQELCLFNHWKNVNNNSNALEFKKIYNPYDVLKQNNSKKLHICIAVYALVSGGGETFPIFLANELFKRGYTITILNCNQEKTNPDIKKMLNSLIPILELDDIQNVVDCFKEMGIQVIHSHHAWVDMTIHTLIKKENFHHVITMHGMYEMIEKDDFANVKNVLENSDCSIVYTADKNIEKFGNNFLNKKKCIKIRNTLPLKKINIIKKTDLNIDENDFVLCMVARAIKSKGLKESIEAVIEANKKSKRKIHLIFIGDGPVYNTLKNKNLPDYIHLLGMKINVRDYFSMSDIGLLPSKFKGESSPLVLIDCLYSGKPLIASNVGEIKYMLSSKYGEAGIIFDLENWDIPVKKLSKIISEIANNEILYKTLLKNVDYSLEKFNLDKMISEYEIIYNEQRIMETI